MDPDVIKVDGYRTISYKGFKIAIELLEYFADSANRGDVFCFVKRADGVFIAERIGSTPPVAAGSC